MTITWDQRIDQFWADADESKPEAAMTQMRSLVAERPVGDPAALYEWASVHDFLGLEEQAIPLYREALDRGLAGEREPQAIIQLASSLRNVGQPGPAAELLRAKPRSEVTGDAAQAFLALALSDAGEPEEALRVALRALASTLPMYRRAVENYADALVQGSSTAAPQD